MGISARTRQALDNEGISTVSQLHEWEDVKWDQFTHNCKWPPQIVDQKSYQDLINQPEFKVPVKSLNRLKEASHIYCFHYNVGRDLSQPNMICNQVTNNFMIQIKAMEQKKKNDVPDVPKVQKGIKVELSANSMIVLLSKVTRAQGIATLSYVTRK